METSDCISSSIISDFTRKAIKNTFYMYAKAVFLSLSSHADKKRNGAPPKARQKNEKDRHTGNAAKQRSPKNTEEKPKSKTTKPKSKTTKRKNSLIAKKSGNKARRSDYNAYF